ncbi:transcription termination factor MTERF8, chloroplastic-like [Tripterygium wilfordii]|uniref:transcription termination factor MTERF8, chloroplastic-like n=1 Tax=Tripterygium wilfordii TaxID=458696 RepID=UPI0018F7FC39|nr:transcription termination factor MTERF8, chloroplastic-like [Tripterygium wilfordii]
MANISLRKLFSLIQKRYFNTSPAAPSAAQFLSDSCGLPLESAISVSKKFQLDEKKFQKLKSVLCFLKSRGFDDTQVVKLIEKRPSILLRTVDGNLKPKFDFLLNNGFSGQLLPELIVANPAVIGRGLKSHIKPSFRYLMSFTGSNENVVAAIRRGLWLLTCDFNVRLKPNIDMLINEGVPSKRIMKLLVRKPRFVIQSNDTTIYAIRTLKNMGMNAKDPLFLRAFCTVISMTESTLKDKFDVFKSLGWNEDQIFYAFRRSPSCFACSREGIKKKVDFYVNTMKLKIETLIENPTVLTYSIDSRSLPRHNILAVLESKNLVEKGIKIQTLLAMSDKVFMEKFVLKYMDQVPNLMEKYKSAKSVKERKILEKKLGERESKTKEEVEFLD